MEAVIQIMSLSRKLALFDLGPILSSQQKQIKKAKPSSGIMPAG